MTNKKMNKKSQVTTFIIIGIIMLFAISITIFVAKYSQNINVVEQQELRRTPIEMYVGECLEQTQKQALLILGDNGGFIDIPQSVLYNPYASSAYGNKREFAIPSWYVMGEIKAPTLDSMEKEISRYIEKNIDFCLGGFGELNKQYNINVLDKPSVRTIINSGSVTTELNYPIEFTLKSNQSKQAYTKFTQNTKIDLYGIYLLATEILQKESSESFLEDITLSLMSTSDKIPFNGITFFQIKKSKKEAKEELQNLLELAMPKIRIENTNYPSFDESKKKYESFNKYDIEYFYKNRLELPSNTPPEDIYEYNRLFVKGIEGNFNNLRASFKYDSSMGIYFEGYPNRNGYLISQARGVDFNNLASNPQELSLMQLSSSLFSNIIHTYHFVYDIYAPILLTIYDEQAFNGEGYKFNFILPVMIGSNKPIKKDIPYLKRESFDLDIYDEESCFKKSKTNIIIRARDAYTGEALEDVNVSYDCFSLSCDLGKTKIEQGDIQLSEQLPNTCIGGFFTLKKQGYATAKFQKIPSYNHFTVLMLPEKEFDLEVIKKPYNNFQSSIGITDAEEVMIKYELLNATIFPRQVDGEGYYVVSPNMDYYNNFLYPSFNDKIKLINGKSRYYLEVYLLKDGRINGGYVGNWSTTYSEMSNKGSLVINVLDFDDYEGEQDAKDYEVTNYIYNNKTYVNKIKPYFK